MSTPNMNLPVPQPGVTPSPDWGTEQQTAMGLIDTHDHTTGKGEQVPTAGININDDLSCRGYALKNVKEVQFLPQASVTDRDAVYVKGVDLYYRDGNGNEIPITSGGMIAGGGGGGGGTAVNIVTVGSVAGLRAASPTDASSLYVYQTAGYASALDGGAGTYQWDPASLLTDDGAFVVKPNAYAIGTPGRWLYRSTNGVFDVRAAGLSGVYAQTGRVNCGLTVLGLIRNCKTYGVNTLKFPAGWFKVNDWPGGLTDPLTCGLNNVTLQGAPNGGTIFFGGPSYAYRFIDVRLIATGAWSANASGSGAGFTLTATANGAGSFDGTLVALNDRVCLPFQANAVHAIIGTVTQVGNAGAPCIVTIASDFVGTLQTRGGARASDGVTNKFIAYTLTDQPGYFTPGATLTGGSGPIYWTLEPFGYGGCSFNTGTDVPIYRAAAPSVPAQRWSQWMQAGDGISTSTPLTNVQFLAGGSWFDPDIGSTFQCQPVVPGTKIFMKCGGTPTDIGWYYQGFKRTVRSIAGNNVYLDKCIPATTIYSFAPGHAPQYLGALSAVGANQVTLTVHANAALVAAGDYVEFTGFTGQYGVVATVNAGTGVITFNVGTMPGGLTTASTARSLYNVFPPDLGTIAAVGSSQITLTIHANAGLVAPGNFVTFASAPGYYGQVVTSNAGTGVITFTPGTMPSSVAPATTCRGVLSFPSYRINQARSQADNDYCVITADSENIAIRDITFDGIVLVANLVSGLWIERCRFINTHAAMSIGGCDNVRMKDCYFHVEGYSLPGQYTGAYSWYGWVVQNNYCSDAVAENTTVFCNVQAVDEEAENETRWINRDVTILPAPVAINVIISGTTSNVTHLNPEINLTVRGGSPSNAMSVLIGQPVTNLVIDYVWSTFNQTLGGAGTTKYLHGRLRWKGREYSLDDRRQWRCTVPLVSGGGVVQRVIRRPYVGLWGPTLISCPDLSVITSIQVCTSGLVNTLDILPLLQLVWAPGIWALAPIDALYGNYPNSSDDDSMAIIVNTSGVVPASNYFSIDAQVIMPANRGDSYEGCTTAVPQLMRPTAQNATVQTRLIGGGSPVGALVPAFPGQEYWDATGLHEWVAYDVLSNVNWSQRS